MRQRLRWHAAAFAAALALAAPAAAGVRVTELAVDPSSAGRAIAAPFPFRALGMRWEGEAPALGVPGIALRFSPGGAAWSDWTQAHIDPDASAAAAASYAFALVFSDAPQTAVELAIPTAWRATGGRLSLVFIDPGETPPIASPRAAEPFDPFERPPSVSRTGWGCPDGASSPAWPPQPTEPTHLVVHHTATSNGATDWPAQVRSIWAYHTVTRDWGDIGYNWLIDPLGTIYEGRSGGDDVIGAHFSCRNPNTMGVALLGNFASELPSEAARESLERLLAFTAERRGLDPLAAVRHPGTDLVLDTILGHRDGNPSPEACTITSCPGDALYALLPGLREGVADALAAPEPGAVAAAVAALLALVSRAARDCGARARHTRRSRARRRPAPARRP